MQKLFLGVVVLTVLFSAGNVYTQDDAFIRWAWDALENYPGWLRESNFDPSPVTPRPLAVPVEGENVQLNFGLSYFAQNFSEPVNVYNVWGRVNEAKLGFEFDTWAGNTSISLCGEYRATGQLTGGAFPIPISGTGHWIIGFAKITQNVKLSNFTVTPEGYIKLSDVPENFYYSALPVWTMDFTMDGLLDEIPEDIAKEVLIKFDQNLKLVMMQDAKYYPPSQLFFNYFQDLFEKTPLVEIIGTTRE